MDGSPLRKMLVGLQAEGPESRVEYAMRLGIDILPLADRIGKSITLRFTGARTCISCGRRVKKFFGQGLCYPCFRDAPEAGPCIIRPELCRAHLGEGRDVQWELDHHLQEHIVYLAFTGGVKVGVTRSTQVPVRWIDQGAELAVPIARVPYRQLAGAIECDLKRVFSDRTDWRAMLMLRDVGYEALLSAREQALAEVDPALREYMLREEEPLRLAYPLPPVPPKLVNVQLDKLDEIDGRLLGVKGQYLVWADGRVLNVRNHSGYHVEIE
jgi:hypothetical protein